MMSFDFPHLQQDNVAFSDISLAPDDLKRLKFLLKGTLHGDYRDELCRLLLAEEIRDTNVPGGMPKPMGKIRITDRGRRYLRFRNKELTRTWVPIVISIFFLLSFLSLRTFDRPEPYNGFLTKDAASARRLITRALMWMV